MPDPPGLVPACPPPLLYHCPVPCPAPLPAAAGGRVNRVLRAAVAPHLSHQAVPVRRMQGCQQLCVQASAAGWPAGLWSSAAACVQPLGSTTLPPAARPCLALLHRLLVPPRAIIPRPAPTRRLLLDSCHCVPRCLLVCMAWGPRLVTPVLLLPPNRTQDAAGLVPLRAGHISLPYLRSGGQHGLPARERLLHLLISCCQ